MATANKFGLMDISRGAVKVRFDKFGEQIASKAMMLMETELRRPLEWMGLAIGAETDAKTARNMMELASIQVRHLSFDNKPSESGFYFYQHKKLVHILYDPKFEQKKDRLHIRINRGVIR